MYRPRFNPGMQVRPTIASAPASVIFWLMSRWFLALKRMKPEEMAYLHGYRNLCRHFQRTACVLGPSYLKRRLAQRNLANYTLYDTWNDPKDDTSLDNASLHNLAHDTQTWHLTLLNRGMDTRFDKSCYTISPTDKIWQLTPHARNDNVKYDT